MRWIIVVILTGMMAPVVWGQATADKSQGERGGNGRQMMRSRGMGFRGGEGRGMPPASQASQEEWTQAQQFMKEHSPERWKAFNNRLNPDQQARLRPTIIRRYRMLQILKNNQKEFYHLRLKRMKTEDDIFGLKRDWKVASATNKPKIEEKLKWKLGELVDLGIREHRLRIERFKKLIAREQKQIASEQKDREQTVAKHLKAIEKERGRLGEPKVAKAASPTTQPSGSDAAP